MELHLDSDAFTVCYVPGEVEPNAILKRIRSLGYRPERIALADLGKPTAPGRPVSDGAAPEPIASALDEAGELEKLVLLDFYASWCAPCRKLEKDLARPEVKKALEKFVVTKVDTDKQPKAAAYFNVRTLPTLIILDRDGKQRFLHVGLLSPEKLIAELGAAAKASKKRGRKESQ